MALVSLLGIAAAQDALLELELTMTNDPDLPHQVAFVWEGAPDVVLQRSPSLATHDWTTLLDTRGQRTFSESRFEQLAFYRLVRLPELGSTTLSALEWRLTEMNARQIERAVNPMAHDDPAFGETPPDDGDGVHSRNLFGGVVPYAWASQPGLIRVFTPDGFERAFKLYSSNDSVVSDSSELSQEWKAMDHWQEAPHQFTDLNEPIAKGDGEKRFPILDPRAETVGVEGFAIDEEALLGTIPGEALPMPAEWLYVLEDGSLGTVDAGGRWTGEGTPSESNPIAARLAYWADDESTKINVNVASEGIPWDAPRADTPRERDYAWRQPLTQEIQRHPGHPAQTSLSSVLYPGKFANHNDPDKRLRETELKHLFELAVRAAYRDPAEGTLTLDDDPWFLTEASWKGKAHRLGFTHAHQLTGFVTTSNPAPEITVHGFPRMSIWPLHERDASPTRSAYDDRSAALSTLGEIPYHFLRRDPSSHHAEFYALRNRHNVRLFKMIMDQVYERIPGYGRSLAAKYGARLSAENYADDTDYDKDHYAITLGMFDRIRSSNIADPTVGDPYADVSHPHGMGAGMVTSLNLMGRNLDEDDGSSQHVARWDEASLEPLSAGRNFTLSEVALVAYVTTGTKIARWNDDGPTFENDTGPDREVLKRILANEHPGYRRQFSAADEGKTFYAVEVGLLPELFSPAHGYPGKAPRQSLRLLTGGHGYRGGVSWDHGLKLNGESLSLWGHAIENADSPQKGPLISTVESDVLLTELYRFPGGWRSTGGLGGPRLMQFGTFTFDPEMEGYHGGQFLANGQGPWSHWYCQNLVVVEQGEDLVFTQDEPIQIAQYDAYALGANTSRLARVFHLRLAPPGEELRVPGPEPGTASYRGWTRRIRQSSSVASLFPTSFLLDRTETEVVKGLSVAHGDHRHVAVKRIIPSELMTHHPLAEKRRSSHSLMWSTINGNVRDTAATQGLESIGRSLVEGVRYAYDIVPDFVGDPSRRSRFAPLLGDHYHFPIDPTRTRDFDNGLAREPDGPYINSADHGDAIPRASSLVDQKWPYFDHAELADVAPPPLATRFARRMAPSPVAFGSLPSAAQANAPWTCLLFRPNVSDPNRYPHLGERGHGMIWERNRSTLDGLEVPQMASVTDDPALPPDHLWLDYFWMPTATHPGIASPLATQGKVNMNYQLFPYTHIKRATAMHAVLKAEEILAIPTAAGGTYKSTRDNPNWRHRIDAEETLKQFEARFAQGDIFLTESEICEQFLVPEGQTWAPGAESLRDFWNAHRLSGDNTLERPYAGLYSRLTTRSNAFRIHYRIQLIEKSPDSPADRFDPNSDRITDEKRGAKVLERILDSKAVPDAYLRLYETTDRPRLEQFYRTLVRDVP